MQEAEGDLVEVDGVAAVPSADKELDASRDHVVQGEAVEVGAVEGVEGDQGQGERAAQFGGSERGRPVPRRGTGRGPALPGLSSPTARSCHCPCSALDATRSSAAADTFRRLAVWPA